MTIVEFLTARLDEREHALQPDGPEDNWTLYANWHSSTCESVQPDAQGFCDCGVPERVLADIAVKREIIKWCGERDQIWVGTIASNPDLPDPKDFVPGYLKNPADSMVLRLMASVDSEHPDYQQEWRP